MTIRVAHITTIDMALRFLMLNQLAYIQDAGFEVTTISSPGPNAELIRAAGFRHLTTPISREISPLDDAATLVRLFRLLRRERFDIVHTHNPKPGLLGQLAARFAGTPVIVNTLHGFYFHEHTPPNARRLYVTLEKIAAKNSSLILSQSAEDIETALAEKIAPPAKIQHLGNGIDLTRYSASAADARQSKQMRAELGIPADAPVIGFVGRLAAKRKGFLAFLEAGARVMARIPSAHFLIVGGSDPGKPDSVEPAVAADYGIADRCIFLGERPNEELPAFYRCMDLFVLPSLFEGVPRVIMEASAMGVPIVATDVKGNREAVVPDRNGLLVPYNDVDALAQAMLSILENPALASAFRRGGPEVAHERFDERLVFERVVAAYNQLLNR